MTGDNRRIAIAEEITLARETLVTAELLLAAGRHRDVLNRAYYASFHAVRALLFSRGVEVRGHRALRGQLGLHFTRAGLLPDDFGSTLVRLQDEREDADYGAPPGAPVGPARAENAVRDARTLVAAVEALLVAEGWLAGEGT